LHTNHKQGYSGENKLNAKAMITRDNFPLNHHPETSLHHQNLQRATLLVIEDQDDLWTILRFSLTKQFPDVSLHRCARPEEAMSFLSGGIDGPLVLPKLILQDLYLPQRETGFRLITDIRSLLEGHQQIPILVMSSSVEQADVRQAYQQGASFYIVKPQTLPGWLTLAQRLRHFWWEQGVLPLYPDTDA
jgi:CheY-like chemotaxis protein